MSDDAKQAAWRRLCQKLEPLGVDPYAPEVADDHPHRDEVAAIVAEYQAATTAEPLLPPDWEGHAPGQPVHTLPGLADWIADQWRMVRACELAGEQAKSSALQHAARALRNAHRVLVWFGPNDRPQRPLPPETCDDAKRQFDQLERWVRRKHQSGWEPSPRKAKEAPASKPKRRPKRDAIPDDDEANLQITRILKSRPQATIREVAGEVGLSTGKVSKLQAWKKHMAARRAANPSPKAKERPLTTKMLESIGSEEDPAQKLMREEAIWNYLLSKASRKERESMELMDEQQRAALIETTLDQWGDELPPELRVLE